MSSTVFGSVRAEFALVGELVEKRLVTSPKNPEWKLHVWKIASRGSTFEVQVDRESYDRGMIDGAYQITGQLGNEGSRTKLVAVNIQEVTPRATAQAASTRVAG